MKIQTLRKKKKKQIIVGSVCAIAVLSVGILATSRAKYKVTESINIANGTIDYKVPDFQIVAMYKSEDGTNYTELDGRMPSSGYIINEEKSYCNLNGTKDTNAVLKTVDGNHVIANLVKGDKCYLYFDKYTPPITVDTIIASLNAKETPPDFSKTATTNEGVYKVSDGMYGGTSYYWRGKVENNYVKFAGFCWRIVRINGDKTIRLIYDGTTCHANGTSTAESIAKTSQTYSKDGLKDRSEYVGYTYTVGSQRGTTEASNLKTQTESWFNTNITGTNADKVATGKFCNDRNTASGYTWASQPNGGFYYAVYERLAEAKSPTLICTNESGQNDIYNLKVGAITADEIAFAGGLYGVANNCYYLYNGQSYWTMSPYMWTHEGGGRDFAGVLKMNNDGQLASVYRVDYPNGIRPVINLLSNTEFKAGTDGTQNNPYEVI